MAGINGQVSCADEWNSLESDSGVFRELLELNGVSGVDVVDIYDFDSFLQDSRARDQVLFGYILLLDKSKYQKAMSEVKSEGGVGENLWFARQVVNNSCATHALLSIVMNIDHIKSALLESIKEHKTDGEESKEKEKLQSLLDGVSLGSKLDNFRSFTAAFDAKSKGLAVGNSDDLRSAHNSFSNDSCLLLQTGPERKKRPSSDPRTRLYHFSTYLCVFNALDAVYEVYEIDCLYNEAPLCVLRDKTYDGANKGLISFLQQKLESIGKNDLFFSLMAMVNDRLPWLQKRLNAAKEAGNGCEQVMVQDEINAIERRREAQKKENARRRFNYIPFLVQLLKSLAQNGSIAAIIESSAAVDPTVMEGGEDNTDQDEDDDDDGTMEM